MENTAKAVIGAALLATTWWATSARAAESYDNCTGFIDSLPATIGTQGTWCLRQDVSTAQTSGNAILVQASNVTIDCNDFKIGNLSAGVGTETRGISTQGTRLNLTVRNCGIRGFGQGVVTQAGSGHLVEDNRFDQNRESAISLTGDGVIVRRNRVIDTGGSPANGATSAIFLAGAGTLVADNVISGVVLDPGVANGTVNAINLGDGPHRITNNLIQGLFPTGAGVARGIWGDFLPIYASDNVVVSSAATTGTGALAGSVKSVCRNNSVTNLSAGVTGCTDGGGNVSN